MNTSLESNLRIRAAMLQKARAFFAARGILEVDCPALSPAASVDLHIDVMRVEGMGYLHTSPEYGMKRLLALGLGDIYQLGHVFRKEEVGPLHNPEFTMAEWYRVGISFAEMIEETLAFCRLFLGSNLPVVSQTYKGLLREALGVEYGTVTSAELFQCAKDHGLDIGEEAVAWDKDTLCQLLLSFVVEPQLGKDCLFVVTEFPASQAALAQVTRDAEGDEVAYRFEVYAQGMELANGYRELTDPVEQRRRLEEANAARERAGKEQLPVDEAFLGALERGVPPCCGVAVGFDRLLLLQLGEKALEAVIPFAWS